MDERQALIESKLRLVWSVIRQNRFIALDPAVDDEDLFQVGCVGLVKAADTFKPGGLSFVSYAYCCIYREIGMYVRREKYRGQTGVINTASLDDFVFAGDERTSVRDILQAHDESPESFVLETTARDFCMELKKHSPELYEAFMGNITQKEAGARLGCTQKTISNRVNRQKEKLKELLSA